MAGVSDAYWESRKKKIKFIAGIEIYFNEHHQELVELQQQEDWKIGSLRANKNVAEVDIEQIEREEQYDRFRRNRHLTVLAMNMQGYKNLIHMTSEAWEIGFYYKPRVWFDRIAKYNEGLIILSGCLNGPICHALRQAAKYGKIAAKKYTKDKFGREIKISRDDALRKRKEWVTEANMWVNKFKDLLGDRFYLELQMPGEEIPFGKEAFALICSLSKKYDIPAVVTNDCLSLKFPILMADGTFKPIGDVEIGDLVITHKGRARRVLEKKIRTIKSSEKCFKIKHVPWGMTEGHPLYIDGVSRENSKAHKMPNRASLGSVPLGVGVSWIDTTQYVTPSRQMAIIDGYWKSNSPMGQHVLIPKWLKLTDELLWIIGNYIAEGYKDHYRLNFALHKKEITAKEKIISYFKQFNLNPNFNTKRTNSNNGAVIRICSKVFSDLFSLLCGSLAHNKHLPPFWMDLNKKQARILLDGYLSGDGNIIRGRLGKNGFHWASTSWLLTGQLQVLIASLGGYAKPYFKEAKYYSNSRIDKPQYHGSSGQLSTAIIEESELPNHHSALRAFDPIKHEIPIEWEEIDPINQVCDIEVEEDHSFVLWGNIISRNCHFTNRPDFKVQKCMMAVGQGLKIDDPNLFHVDSDEQFYKSRAQLRQTFFEGRYDRYISAREFEECLENTVKLADRCETFSPDLDPKLPKIPKAGEKLTRLVYENLKTKNLLNSTKKYMVDGQMVTHKEQATIELKRYIEKGFASYFLIIRDLVQFSKKNDWDVGPARGSAGGSLVCYLIGIHSLDPLKWGLSSVRFMGDSRGGNLLKVTME
jgi:hypothetical protein